MPRLTPLVLVAAVAAATLAGCNDDDKKGQAFDATTTTKAGGSPSPTGPPEDCRKLSADALSTHAGTKVELRLPRSNQAVQGGTRGFQCVYAKAGGDTDFGSVVFTVYGSEDEAKKAYQDGLDGAAALGASAVEQKRGDAAYAVDLGELWSCAIRVGKSIAAASLPSDAADKACNWADEALKAFA